MKIKEKVFYEEPKDQETKPEPVATGERRFFCGASGCKYRRQWKLFYSYFLGYHWRICIDNVPLEYLGDVDHIMNICRNCIHFQRINLANCSE